MTPPTPVSEMLNQLADALETHDEESLGPWLHGWLTAMRLMTAPPPEPPPESPETPVDKP